MNGPKKSKYRQTKEWKEFRKNVIEDANYKCHICESKKRKGLHIHHVDESRYGNENKDDVVVLCPTCHKIIEWLLSRTRNPINLDNFCENLKDVYYKSREGNNG